ncbi:MAG: COX15/CtaA family protein [Actinomycetota bacterium]|nr:COX15/CtaA family protein [Acidimicrobiia bacterium]MDQ3294225.1 COX15/CtaA family protein [Actinomycetota bacterium]
MAITVGPARFHRLAVASLGLTLVLVATGAAVRLTGSGLGCADWPGCEQERFVPALELNPMIEFVNRVLSGIGGLTALLVGLASLRLRPWRRDLVVLCVAVGTVYLGTGLLGAVVVSFHLTPQIVSAHLLLALLLVGLATALVERARPREDGDLGTDGPSRAARVVGGGTRRLVVALLPALAVATIAGTIVTGSGPHGGDEDAPRYGFDAGAVARLHSFAVLAFLALLLVVIQRLAREGAPVAVQERARQLLAVAVAQAVVGWVQYFTDVPALLVGIHILGASLVWVAAVRVLLVALGTLEPCPSPPRPSRSTVPSVTPS